MRNFSREPKQRLFTRAGLVSAVSVVVIVLSVLSWQPRDASAQYIVKDIAAVISWAEQLAYNAYQKIQDDIRAGSTSGATWIGSRTTLKAMVKASQAQSDANANTVRASDIAKIAVNRMYTDIGTFLTCESIMGGMENVYAHTWSDALSDQLSRVDNAGEATSGSGGKLGTGGTNIKFAKLACYGNTGGTNCNSATYFNSTVAVTNGLRSGSIDEVGSSTVYQQSKAKDPAMVDAEYNPEMIFKTLVPVKMDDLASMSQADPQLVAAGDEKAKFLQAKWFYAGAVHFCHNLMGPRPAIPTGTQKDTPAGMQATVAAKSSSIGPRALYARCTRIMSYNTRPDCGTGTTLSADCTRTNGICKAMTSETIGGLAKSDFGNCEHGLSQRESELLTVMSCLPMGSKVAYTAGNVTVSMKDTTDEARQCNERIKNHQHMLEHERQSFYDLLTSVYSGK